jgi:FKBP-type peptidyl-prolyl cis-trans isomerase
MRFYIVIIVLGITLFISSCKENRKGLSVREVTEGKKTFEKINKVLVEDDRVLITSYIKRHNLDSMKVSGTGLYYLVWGTPKGDLIKTGNVVEYLYKMVLLDGTLCYQSENSTPKRFKVGQGGVEYGLEQAVLLMRPGQKGKFILPPHLAYGLIGDGKKIPARSIIVYDIEMLNVYR